MAKNAFKIDLLICINILDFISDYDMILNVRSNKSLLRWSDFKKAYKQ